MTAACDIPILLAQGAGDYNLIIFIVVAVLLAVSGLIKRASEKKQEQEAAEARRKAAQTRRQEPKGSPQAPRPAQQVRRPVAPPAPLELPRVEVLQAFAPAQELGEDVEQELRRQEQRLRQEDKRRKKRLAAPKSPEADSAAIEQRLGHLRSQLARPAEPMGRGEAPDLRSRELARSAIIYHVILAPPKALIQGPEMWDR